MKTIVLVVATICFSLLAHAQTFDEWFKQKKTQKKYLIQQIAALEGYIGVAQKGYKIAKDGLGFIGDMKSGEFSLHKDYFNSLKTVNPEIKRYYKVSAIIVLQNNILNTCGANKKVLKKSGMISKAELDYYDKAISRLKENCNSQLDELTMVVSSGRVEMKDDERIKRIDNIHHQMQDNYTFAVSFGNEAKMLATARKQEMNDLITSRALQDIK